MITSLSKAYLTSRQLKIWVLKKAGLKEANIARELNVSRQTVHKALNVADNKILQALEEAASLNKIKVETVNVTKGILVGYSPEFRTKAVITFSARNGVHIWYKHNGDCANCDHLQICEQTLAIEMEDRDIQLPENLAELLPSKLAEILFSKILDEKT